MTRRSLIFSTTVRAVFDSAIVLSLYLLFAGHNRPGGGFVGGIVAGAALGLQFVDGGIDQVDRTLRVRPWTVLSIGLGLSAATAALPLLWGRPVLSQPLLELELPLFGAVKATGALPFDIGVYLVVVAVVAMVLDAIDSGVAADDGDQDGARRRETAT